MPKRRSAFPVSAGMDWWMLGVDASAVIGLRMLKMAQGGPAAADEAVLMVREKIDTATDIQTAFMTGRLGMTPDAVGRSIVKRVAGKVRANRRRLS